MVLIVHDRIRNGCSNFNFDLHKNYLSFTSTCYHWETQLDYLLECKICDIERADMLRDLSCSSLSSDLGGFHKSFPEPVRRVKTII